MGRDSGLGVTEAGLDSRSAFALPRNGGGDTGVPADGGGDPRRAGFSIAAAAGAWTGGVVSGAAAAVAGGAASGAAAAGATGAAVGVVAGVSL